ncbi:MAG: hypothetical protein NVV74_26210 [Magnetospirillum sp.]|nr:hypothetical protein [Magnetospirillum sp.]
MATRESREKNRAPRDKSRPHPGKGNRPEPPRGERGGRPPGNLFWLYGQHAVAAALDNPQRKIRRLALTADAARAWHEVLERAGRARSLPAADVVDKAEPGAPVAARRRAPGRRRAVRAPARPCHRGHRP